MKQKIKKIKKSLLRFKNGDNNSTDPIHSYLQEETIFDANQRLLNFKKFNSYDILEEKTIKTYDKNTEICEYFANEDGISEKTIISFDEEGRIIEKTTEYSAGFSTKELYKYEENQIKKIIFDIEDGISKEAGIKTTIFDKNGNITEEEEYECGDLNHYIKRKYNENNKLIRQETFFAIDGKPTIDEFEWQDDFMMKNSTTNIYGKKTITKYTANAEGLTEKIDTISPIGNISILIKYDDMKNVVNEKTIDANGNTYLEIVRKYMPNTQILLREDTYSTQSGIAIHSAELYEYEFYE